MLKPFFFILDDGSPPDLDYLLDNYRDQVTCRRTKSQVCAKFTYSFNNEGKYRVHSYQNFQKLMIVW